MVQPLRFKNQQSKFPSYFQELSEEFLREVVSSCRESLNRIEQAGVPWQGVVFFAMRAALRHFDYFSPGVQAAFRARKDEAHDHAQECEALATKIREFPWFADSTELRNMYVALEVQRVRASTAKAQLGKYLHKHGAKNHDQAIPLIVSGILSFKPEFDAWAAVRDVVEAAYHSAGRQTGADFEKLMRMAADHYRKSNGGVFCE
jgi:hypothetical protein